MWSTGQTLYRRARKVMPGGTQLLSKRPEMFLPEQWPTYFKSAKGAEVVDLDGKTYLDMSYCGIGATILGVCRSRRRMPRSKPRSTWARCRR